MGKVRRIEPYVVRKGDQILDTPDCDTEQVGPSNVSKRKGGEEVHGTYVIS